MRNFLSSGGHHYQTLPSNYRNYVTKVPSGSSLPPRPSVARSSSLSETHTSRERNLSPLKRTGSVLGLHLPMLAPLSRSQSLANLGQRQDRPEDKREKSRVSLKERARGEHAGIWSRGRRSESCRNLKELKDQVSKSK